MHARVYDDGDVTACERIITRDTLQLETHTARRATPRTLNVPFATLAARQAAGVTALPGTWKARSARLRDRERTGAPAGAKKRRNQKLSFSERKTHVCLTCSGVKIHFS